MDVEKQFGIHIDIYIYIDYIDMDIVLKRTEILRKALEKIQSNRARLDHLKDYYSGKTAIVIATGPGFQDYVDLIKENTNENTIIICIKQSLKCFDYVADFHILNRDHLEKYDYINPKPITLILNYPKRIPHSYGDINFYIQNRPGFSHKRLDNWNEIDNNRDSLSLNDKNIGSNENMVFNGGHIMMEIVLPLCIHLGIKNIITNGWVGGSEHGIDIKNEQKWAKFPYLYEEQKTLIRISEKLPKFMLDHFNTNIYTICDSQYKIEKIDKQKYIDIITNE
jgi:hypothetical protein